MSTNKRLANCCVGTAFIVLFLFWWSVSMLLSQVLFRGQFNDGAIGTVMFLVMVLTAYGFSRYTRAASRLGDKKGKEEEGKEE
jgi:drug/metabolite transporter (DMT)-like permease